MTKPEEWMNRQYEEAYEEYEIYPYILRVLDEIKERIEDEILFCEKAEAKGKKTDLDFFIECRKEYPIFRIHKILNKVYGETCITKLTESYTYHEIGFHIDRYYDWIESEVIKELVETFDKNFRIKRDETNRLTIIVKKVGE